MGKIWELLNAPETVLVFDIDGTLISYNYGEYRAHHKLDQASTEEEFKGIDIYNGCRGIPVIREFLQGRDLSRVYCLSMEPHEHDVSKRRAIHQYYGIAPSHIYLVADHSEKPATLTQIAKEFGENTKVVFIDDNSKVLRAVEEQTPFSTAHVSIFFEDRESVISLD